MSAVESKSGNRKISDKDKRQRERFEVLIKDGKWSEIIHDLSDIQKQIKRTGGEQYYNSLFYGIRALVASSSVEDESCPPISVFGKFVRVQPKVLEWGSETGQIPMHLLSKCKNLKLLKWMIHQNPQACLIVQHDLKGIHRRRMDDDEDWNPKPDEIVPPSALHMAIEAEWEEAVDYLIDIITHDHYPPITSSIKDFFRLITCVNGQTPLHWACQRSNENIILKVLRAFPSAVFVADTSDKTLSPLLATSHRDYYVDQYQRKRCLDISVYRELLNAFPAAIRLQCRSNGFLPLHYALTYDGEDPNKIELFLDMYPKGAGISTKEGRYPLALAIDQKNLPVHLIEKIASLSSFDVLFNVAKEQARSWSRILRDESPSLEAINNDDVRINNPEYPILAKLQTYLQTKDKFSSALMVCINHMETYPIRTIDHTTALNAVTVPTRYPSGTTSFLSFLCLSSALFHPCDFSKILETVPELLYGHVYQRLDENERETLDLTKRKVMKVLVTALMPSNDSDHNRQVSFLHELYTGGSNFTPELAAKVIEKREIKISFGSCQTCGKTGKLRLCPHSWLDVVQRYLPRSLIEAHAKLVDFHGYLPLHRLLVDRPWMIATIPSRNTFLSPTRRTRTKVKIRPLLFTKEDVSFLLSLFPGSTIIPVAHVVPNKVKNNEVDCQDIDESASVAQNPYTGFFPFMLPAVKNGKIDPCLDTTYELLKYFVAECSLTNLGGKLKTL